jgi:hypothetical protein
MINRAFSTSACATTNKKIGCYDMPATSQHTRMTKRSASNQREQAYYLASKSRQPGRKQIKRLSNYLAASDSRCRGRLNPGGGGTIPTRGFYERTNELKLIPSILSNQTIQIIKKRWEGVPWVVLANVPQNNNDWLFISYSTDNFRVKMNHTVTPKSQHHFIAPADLYSQKQ